MTAVPEALMERLLEPQPWDIGLSAEMQRVIYESFLENGCAL